MIRTTVCRPGATTCSKLESVQPPVISFLEPDPNQVVDGGGELQSCDEATKTMRVFMAVFGGFLPAGEELVDIVDISCRACLGGENLIRAPSSGASTLYSCRSCDAGSYLIPSISATCHPCPAGAECSADGLIGRINGSEWRADAESGMYRLTACPVGTLLVNSSHDDQQCLACARGTFSEDPTEGCDATSNICPQRQCNPCPVGAVCENGVFAPRDEHSTWTTVTSSGGRRIKRVVGCDAGAVLVRGGDTVEEATRDQCWHCPPGSYSITRASFYPLSVAVARVEEAAGMCVECDDHARCPGGSTVLPKRGFWMLPLAPDDDEAEDVSSARRNEEEEDEEEQSSRVELYTCPLNACLEGGKCNEGRVGHVCGLCDSDADYVLSGSQCFQCDGSDEKARIWVLLAIAVPTMLFAWYLAAWQPYFVPAPIVEQEDEDEDEEGETKKPKPVPEQKSGKVAKWKAVLTVWLWRPTVIESFKLFISFWQVASTLETHYKIEWPSELSDLWRRMSLFRAGLQSISALNCTASKLGYLSILQIYLITPLLVAFILWIPSLVLILTGNAKFWPFANTQNRFWTSLLYWQFITYPIMATISMQGFSCRRIGDKSWLVADLSVPCPADDLGGVYGWSLFGALVYPFGIPILLYAVLVHFRVPEIAKVKRQDAIVREMLAVYKKVSDRALSTKIAAYIVRESDKKLLTERAEERAEGMFREASQDGYTRSIVELSAYLHSQGLAANHEDEIRYLFKHAPRVDPDIAWFEKHKGVEQSALQAMILKHRPVSGKESLEELDGVAIKELCRFRWHDLLPEEYKPSTDFDKEWDVIPEWLLDPPQSDSANHRPAWVLRHGDEDLDAEQLQEAEAKRPERVQWLVGMGEFLLKHGAIRLPPLEWTGETKAEKLAMDRVGLLFQYYQCDLWYYEFIEMARKFMMCAVVLFLHPGTPLQAVLGLSVAVLFLLFAIASPPYVDWSMNVMQRLCLSILSASLLYGLLLEGRRWVPAEGSADTDIFKVLILGAHAFMFVLPILMILLPTVLAKWNFHHWSTLWKGRSGFSRSVLKRNSAYPGQHGTLTKQPSGGLELTRKSSGMPVSKQNSMRQNSDRDKETGFKASSRQNSANSFHKTNSNRTSPPQADMVFDSIPRREISAMAPGVYATPPPGSRSDSGGGVGLFAPLVDVEHGKRLGSFGRQTSGRSGSRNGSQLLSRSNSGRALAATNNDPDRVFRCNDGWNDPDRILRTSALDPEPFGSKRSSGVTSIDTASTAIGPYAGSGLSRERSSGGLELLQSGAGSSRPAMAGERQLQPVPSVIREESSISSMHELESKSPHNSSRLASVSHQGSLHSGPRDNMSSHSAHSIAASDGTVTAQPLTAVSESMLATTAVSESMLAGGASLQDRWPAGGVSLQDRWPGLAPLRSPKHTQAANSEVAHC